VLIWITLVSLSTANISSTVTDAFKHR